MTCYIHDLSPPWHITTMTCHKHDQSQPRSVTTMTGHNHDLSQPWHITTTICHNHDTSQPWPVATMTGHNHDLSQPWHITTMTCHNHDTSQPRSVTTMTHHNQDLSQPWPVTTWPVTYYGPHTSFSWSTTIIYWANFLIQFNFRLNWITPPCVVYRFYEYHRFRQAAILSAYWRPEHVISSEHNPIVHSACHTPGLSPRLTRERGNLIRATLPQQVYCNGVWSNCQTIFLRTSCAWQLSPGQDLAHPCYDSCAPNMLYDSCASNML